MTTRTSVSSISPSSTRCSATGVRCRTATIERAAGPSAPRRRRAAVDADRGRRWVAESTAIYLYRCESELRLEDDLAGSSG